MHEHLDNLRDYLICGYVAEVGSWLDTEAFDAWCADYYANYWETIKGSSIEDTAFNLEAAAVPTLIGRAYVEGCDLEEVKAFVLSMCQDAIDAHKEIINSVRRAPPRRPYGVRPSCEHREPLCFSDTSPRPLDLWGRGDVFHAALQQKRKQEPLPL